MYMHEDESTKNQEVQTDKEIRIYTQEKSINIRLVMDTL